MQDLQELCIGDELDGSFAAGGGRRRFVGIRVEKRGDQALAILETTLRKITVTCTVG